MRFFLNAIVAKRVGVGGFQIACNFARFAIKDCQNDWHLIVSEEMYNFLKDEFCTNNLLERVHVFPTQPNWHSYLSVRKQLRQLEENLSPVVVYSILAPSYFSFSCLEVMRCCNAWNFINGSHIACKVSGIRYSMRMRLKAPIAKFLMRKTPYFITQTQDAKKNICKSIGTSSNNVRVIPNVLNNVFANADKTNIIHDGFNILFVGALAPHKNVNILPFVCKVLKEKYMDMKFKLITTFDEMSLSNSGLPELFEKCGVNEMWENVGHKSQRELVDVYRISDLGFFPSLLETFSATLIEYMCFGLPIVAADMPFNSEVLGPDAMLYPPLDAEAAAAKIYTIYRDPELMESMRTEGYKRLEKYSDFNKYYNETLRFLKEVAGRNQQL